MGTRDAANCPGGHRAPPTAECGPAPEVTRAEVEDLGVKLNPSSSTDGYNLRSHVAAERRDQTACPSDDSVGGRIVCQPSTEFKSPTVKTI